MRREASKSEDDFAREVQEAMATGLGVETTNFTCADKLEYLKRVLFRPTFPSEYLSTLSNSPDSVT